jgi:hypothetical protein
MEHILYNEVLYQEITQEIKKTYNQATDRYGLHSTDGKQLEAVYLHIFPYSRRGWAAAIKSNNQYVWINTDFIEEPMLDKDRWLIDVSVPANSVCNCMPAEDLNCQLCEGGYIFNTLNFRMVEEQEELTVYEYDTEYNTYRIQLNKNNLLTCPEDLLFDYIWNIDEFEKQIRWAIDAFEDIESEFKNTIRVCLVKNNDDNTSVQLITSTVSIDLIDTSISMVVTKDKIILGFDEFPYS